MQITVLAPLRFSTDTGRLSDYDSLFAKIHANRSVPSPAVK